MAKEGKKGGIGLVGATKTLKEIAKEDKLLSVVTGLLGTTVLNYFATGAGYEIIVLLVVALLGSAGAGAVKHVFASKYGVLEATGMADVEWQKGLKYYQLSVMLRNTQVEGSNISSLLIMLENELDEETPSKTMIGNIRGLIDKMHRNSMKGHDTLLEKFENWAVDAFGIDNKELPIPVQKDPLTTTEDAVKDTEIDINSKTAGHEII